MRNRWVVFAIVSASLGWAGSATAASAFYFTSAKASWIGQGQTLNIAAATASRYYNQGVYTNSVSVAAGGYALRIVEPNLTLPTVGRFDATRWPFMGSGAGMDFTGPGRGNNTLTGWFNVLQADYAADGSVLSLAVDFKQYDEGNLAAWNEGAVRFNSSIPIPEPACLTLLLAIPLWQRRRAA